MIDQWLIGYALNPTKKATSLFLANNVLDRQHQCQYEISTFCWWSTLENKDWSKERRNKSGRDKVAANFLCFSQNRRFLIANNQFARVCCCWFGWDKKRSCWFLTWPITQCAIDRDPANAWSPTSKKENQTPHKIQKRSLLFEYDGKWNWRRWWWYGVLVSFNSNVDRPTRDRFRLWWASRVV